MLNNLTILVPTHNRHNYLLRSIEYFLNYKIRTIYLDSTEHKLHFTNNINNNIEYYHLPGKKFVQKIFYGLTLVNSKYTLLCADDDFINLENIDSYLDHDYNAIIGNIVYFYKNYDGNFYFLTQIISDYSINYNKRKNAKHFFSNYQNILWAIIDSKILKEAFLILNNYIPQNDNFIEFVISVVLAGTGNLKFINSVLNIRELADEPHWGNLHKSLINYFSDINIKKEFIQYEKQLDKFYGLGFTKYCLYNYFNSYNKKYLQIIKQIIKKYIPLPEIIKKRHNLTFANKYPQMKNCLSQEKWAIEINRMLLS